MEDVPMRINPGWFAPAAIVLSVIACSSPNLAAEIRSDTEAGRTVISITGPIEAGDYDRFLDALDRGRPDLLVLSSPGGNLSEGLAIAAEIALLGLPTFVGSGGSCFSACALIWVAGAPRIMSIGAEIGVHAAYYLVEEIDGSLKPIVSSVGNANIGAFLNGIGLDVDAIEFFVAPPPDSVALLTPRLARLLNIPVLLSSDDGSGVRASGPSPRALVGEAALYTHVGTTCAHVIDADRAVLAQQAQVALRVANTDFDVERIGGLIVQEARRIRDEIDDLGILPWCLSAFLRLADAGRPIGIEGPSYPCARAGTLTERSICANPKLWIYDRFLSSVYDARRLTLPAEDAAALISTQRSWLRRRDGCTDDPACLETLYSSRLEEIR
jgi:uncharacterized protein YecT (DUF1311 family)